MCNDQPIAAINDRCFEEKTRFTTIISPSFTPQERWENNHRHHALLQHTFQGIDLRPCILAVLNRLSELQKW
tara:strand:+ start:1907 stop:2122 length:216 start_codon:yes stop_codon:yes gene_type:complete